LPSWDLDVGGSASPRRSANLARSIRRTGCGSSCPLCAGLGSSSLLSRALGAAGLVARARARPLARAAAVAALASARAHSCPQTRPLIFQSPTAAWLPWLLRGSIIDEAPHTIRQARAGLCRRLRHRHANPRRWLVDSPSSGRSCGLRILRSRGSRPSRARTRRLAPLRRPPRAALSRGALLGVALACILFFRALAHARYSPPRAWLELRRGVDLCMWPSVPLTRSRSLFPTLYGAMRRGSGMARPTSVSCAAIRYLRGRDALARAVPKRGPHPPFPPLSRSQTSASVRVPRLFVFGSTIGALVRCGLLHSAPLPRRPARARARSSARRSRSSGSLGAPPRRRRLDVLLDACGARSWIRHRRAVPSPSPLSAPASSSGVTWAQEHSSVRASRPTRSAPRPLSWLLRSARLCCRMVTDVHLASAFHKAGFCGISRSQSAIARCRSGAISILSYCETTALLSARAHRQRFERAGLWRLSSPLRRSSERRVAYRAAHSSRILPNAAAGGSRFRGDDGIDVWQTSPPTSARSSSTGRSRQELPMPRSESPARLPTRNARSPCRRARSPAWPRPVLRRSRARHTPTHALTRTGAFDDLAVEVHRALAGVPFGRGSEPWSPGGRCRSSTQTGSALRVDYAFLCVAMTRSRTSSAMTRDTPLCYGAALSVTAKSSRIVGLLGSRAKKPSRPNSVLLAVSSDSVRRGIDTAAVSTPSRTSSSPAAKNTSSCAARPAATRKDLDLSAMPT